MGTIARRPAFASALLACFATSGFAQEFEPNHVFVASYYTDRVLEFDREGVFVRELGGLLDLDGPEGIAFGPDGRLYVASEQSDEIKIFGGSALDDSFDGGADLDSPVGLAFGPNGNLFVASRLTGRVVEFTLQGSLVRLIGAGSGLVNPQSVAFDASGHLYVTDSASDEVFEFDPSGALVRQFGSASLDGPLGMAFAPGAANRVVVASLHQDAIKTLDADGQQVDAIVNVAISDPRQIAFGPDGNLYVASDGANRVAVFDPVSETLVRNLGDDAVLSGVGGIAFAPFREYVTVRGKLVKSDGIESFANSASLYYAPGSGTVSLGFQTPDAGKPSYRNEFGSHYLVLHGFEHGIGEKVAVGASAAFWPSIDGGLGSIEAIFTGKRDALGQFRVKSVKGTVHRSSADAQLTARIAPPPKPSAPK